MQQNVKSQKNLRLKESSGKRPNHGMDGRPEVKGQGQQGHESHTTPMKLPTLFWKERVMVCMSHKCLYRDNRNCRKTFRWVISCTRHWGGAGGGSVPHRWHLSLQQARVRVDCPRTDSESSQLQSQQLGNSGA